MMKIIMPMARPATVSVTQRREAADQRQRDQRQHRHQQQGRKVDRRS